MKLGMRVYADKRDMTKFVSRVLVQQQRNASFRDFTLDFAGYHPLEPSQRWDIFGTYGSNAMANLLIRRGQVAPDDFPALTLQTGTMPVATVTGHDWAWHAQRISPRQAIIIAPSSREATAIVKALDYPMVRYRLIQAQTMHQAVVQLAAMAGFWAELLIPDYLMGMHVLDPRKTLWDHISDLVKPFKPYVLARRSRNTVMFADSVTWLLRSGSKMVLGPSAIRSITIKRRPKRYVRSIIIRVRDQVTS